MITVFFLLLLTIPLTLSLTIKDYSNGQCIVSANTPTQPNALGLCHWYNAKACCLPQLDADNEAFFHAMAGLLGLSCSIAKQTIKTTYLATREWYCLGCDPDEPRYRFKKKQGDMMLAGGQIPATPSVPETTVSWRVCKTFIHRLWQMDGTIYDQCGIMTENPCNGGMQSVLGPSGLMTTKVPYLPGWDQYMCGDNLVVPSKQFANEPDPAVAFLASIPPPGFGDVGFMFSVVDDTKADFLWDSTPCFRGLTGGAGSKKKTQTRISVEVINLVPGPTDAPGVVVVDEKDGYGSPSSPTPIVTNRFLKSGRSACGAKPGGRSAIGLLEKLNKIASSKVSLRAKFQHVFAPTSSSTAALSGTRWVTMESVYSYWTMVLILTSVTIFLVDSMPEYYDSDDAALSTIETVCISFFTVDFLGRLFTTPQNTRDFKNYMTSPQTWLDVVSIIPYYLDMALDRENIKGLFILRVFRLTRIMRIFKFGRYNAGAVILVNALQNSGTAMSILGFFLSIAILVCSTAVYYAEMTESTFDTTSRLWIRQGKISPFQSIFAAMWWAVTTLTTVGYGDVVPITTLGKIVGGFTMIMGVLVIALPVVLIGNNFQEAYVAYMQARLIVDIDGGGGRKGDEPPPEVEMVAGYVPAVARGYLGAHHSIVCRFTHESRWHDLATYDGDLDTFFYTPTCVWDFDRSQRAVRYSPDDAYNVFTVYIIKDSPALRAAAFEALCKRRPNALLSDVVCMPVTMAKITVPNFQSSAAAALQDKYAGGILTSVVHQPSSVIPISFNTSSELPSGLLIRMLPYVSITCTFTTAHSHEVECTVSSMALYDTTDAAHAT